MASWQLNHAAARDISFKKSIPICGNGLIEDNCSAACLTPSKRFNVQEYKRIRSASRQAVAYIVWCEEKLVWILCEFFIRIHTNSFNFIKNEDQKTSIYCGLFRLSGVHFLWKSQLQNRVSLVFVREPTTNRLIKYDTPDLIAEKSYQGWCLGLSRFENDNLFKAVVLSYNATHMNWQLSIKQVVEKD